jgi:hypothetical protein
MGGTSRHLVLRRATLRLSGTVALVAAAHQMATGLSGVLTADTASTPAAANVDSELRFYSVWYAVAGALMHRAAVNPQTDRAIRPLLEIGWSAASASRLLSVRRAGRPHRFFLGLAAVEAAVAAVLVANPPSTTITD